MKHVRQRHWAGRWGVLGWPLLGRSQGPVCPLTDHPDRGSLSLQGTQIYTWWGGGEWSETEAGPAPPVLP